MRNKVFGTALATVLACTMALNAGNPQKNENTTVYMYGCAASFLDSTVYFTEIHPVDSVVIAKGSGFLMGRQLYSEQLQNYLELVEETPHMTCAVYFGKKEAPLKKKYQKMMKDYQAEKHLVVKTLPKSDFTFVKADWIESSIVEGSQPKAKKARKK